jgi:hypothetical protein
MNHDIPPEWLREAGLQHFTPSTPGYRCDTEHESIAMSDIEPCKRLEGVVLDANGFNRQRMIKILVGIRDGESLPPIIIWPAEPGLWRFALRDGFHRFYAARTLKFSHIPVDIIERY